MKKLLLAFALLPMLAGCAVLGPSNDINGVPIPLVARLQSAMVKGCNFLPEIDSAAAMIKAADASAGIGSDIIDALAHQACLVITGHGASEWIVNGVKVKGEFVKGAAAAPLPPPAPVAKPEPKPDPLPSPKPPKPDESPFPPGYGEPKN
jgi:hypothetical protein